jgi:SAM-dependent methyltransferase
VLPDATITYWEAAAKTRWGTYLTDAHRRTLVQALDLAPRVGAALEVGCEGGRWSRYLAERWPTICTDVNAEALAVCAERLPDVRCLLVRPEDTRLPVGDGELATLLVFEVEPVVSASWFPAEAARVLMPDGIVAFTYYNPASIRGAIHRALALAGNKRREHGFYRGRPYSAFRRSMRAAGIEIVRDEGVAWGPFTRESNARLVPVAVVLERALGLRRLSSVSPWVLAIGRRT